MTTVDIRALDIDDAEMVDAWFGVRLASAAVDFPDDPKPSRRAAVSGMRNPWPGQEAEEWVAVVDDRIVATMRIGFNTIENLHSAYVSGSVHPGHRRRGIGRALWSHALDRVRAKGRTTIGADAADTVEGGPQRDRAGMAFLEEMGLTSKLVEARRRLDLSTVDEAAAADQLAEAWSHATGYHLRVWITHTPPDLVEGTAYLESRLLVDAPTGDLDIEPLKVDAQRARDHEAIEATKLLTSAHAALVHTATGQLAAWSCISHEIDHDGHADQNITIVDPDHRGHRLGTVVKLELHRYVHAVTPGLRVIYTWNAASNGHMIRINELLGYRPLDTWHNYQAELAAPDIEQGDQHVS